MNDYSLANLAARISISSASTRSSLFRVVGGMKEGPFSVVVMPVSSSKTSLLLFEISLSKEPAFSTGANSVFGEVVTLTFFWWGIRSLVFALGFCTDFSAIETGRNSEGPIRCFLSIFFIGWGGVSPLTKFMISFGY